MVVVVEVVISFKTQGRPPTLDHRPSVCSLLIIAVGGLPPLQLLASCPLLIIAVGGLPPVNDHC